VGYNSVADYTGLSSFV